jgi:hypothetical protein
MKFIKIAGAGGVVAVAIAMALTAAAYASSGFEEALVGSPLGSMPASAASGGSLFDKEVAVYMSKGISYGRALQALDVQNKVAQTDVVRKLEAGMAGTSGGVWFEPATAQLHVGVTSPAGRQAAEAVVAGEGLTTNVVVTPVRSTMAELVAAQERWSRRLTNLSVNAGISTGIEPRHNAVVVRLDSSVPPAELAVLKREASAADVNVIVSVVAGRLNFRPMAKTECKKWEYSRAYCNPSITSGVTIAGVLKKCEKVAKVEKGPEFFATQKECEERVKPGTKGEWEREVPICSAGPLAINEKTERVLLTAGHCISEKTEKEAWWGITKAEKETKIGLTGTFVAGGPNAEKPAGDYAEVRIEPAWQTGKEKPSVFAVTAEWKKMNEKKEEVSYPVKNEKTPVEGMTSCHVGQTSGESCGAITTLNVKTSYKVNGKLRFFSGLVEVIEVKKETLENKGGDSGGPELAIEEPSQEARMEGMDVAGAAECVEITEEREGLRFFKTKAECNEEEKPGKGKWEQRTISMLFQPLKKVIETGPEGALEKLKLKLLTKENE